MIPLKFAICDDDAIALASISGAMQQIMVSYGVDCEIHCFSSGKELLNSEVFDVIFLDIDMPEMDGIDCGKELRKKDVRAEIVFVSAREDRVFDSFYIRPFAFVRKTHFLTDIADVIGRYLAAASDERLSKVFLFATHEGSLNVVVFDIEYIEGSNVYQQLYIKGAQKPIEILSRLEKLEKALEPYGFMRIHKGYLVNYSGIRRINKTTLITLSGKELPISRRCARKIKDDYLALGRRFGVTRI